MPRKFTVAFTADFSDATGKCKYQDIGLSLLDAEPQIIRRVFGDHRKTIGPDQLADVHGVVVLTPSVTAESISKADDLLVISRFGVGYDSVDVKACTAANVLVAITAGAVDYSVAEATLGWMIALTHHMRIKDTLVRTGQWEARNSHMGRELRDRTLGIIGFGGIARKLIELLRPFAMNQPLAFDPFISPEKAAQGGARLISLEQLLRESDFVSIHCPLTPTTRGLIGANELALMKRDACLINTARGGIVDESALYIALKEHRIAGAAIDCFAQEPLLAPHPLREFDNVLLAPHSICWTNEFFRDVGRAACQVMVDLSLGHRPRGILNPEVFESPAFQAKWKRISQHGTGPNRED